MSTSTDSDIHPAPSAGQILRQARLKAGVHLAVLSVHLKVPVRQLEALEADVWDPVKGPVFYRALASSVCRQLNTDPGPVLALLPRAPGQLESAKSLHDSDRPNRLALDRRSPFRRSSLGKYLLLSAVTAALLVSWAWWPTISAPDWLGRDLLRFSFFTPNSPQWVTQEVQVSPSSVGLSPAGATLETREALSPTPTSGQGAQPLSSVTSTQETAAAQSASSEPSKLNTAAQWIFSATAESWLELRNSKDVVIWSGMLKPGETQRIDSPLPVRVVVGRAQVVTVSLRGQPFDLKPHTQVTVARFEVKE